MPDNQTPEIRNVLISGTSLGNEDHGIMSAWLYLEWQGGGQGFGGYALDTPNGEKGDSFARIGSAYGMEFIKRTIETVGAPCWEKLPGKYIRIKHTRGKVYAIGHITDEKWFSPEDLYSEMCETEDA